MKINKRYFHSFILTTAPMRMNLLAGLSPQRLSRRRQPARRCAAIGERRHCAVQVSIDARAAITRKLHASQHFPWATGAALLPCPTMAAPQRTQGGAAAGVAGAESRSPHSVETSVLPANRTKTEGPLFFSFSKSIVVISDLLFCP